MPSDRVAYRPVSGLAVAAAVVGAASALALASPFFWVLPLIGGVVALAALADVERVGAKKAGRLAALVGLALALGFGAQAIAATVTARWIAAARAESTAEVWLTAIRTGRPEDARSMCGPEAQQAVEDLGSCATNEPDSHRCTGVGEEPGSWVVLVTLGRCELRLVLAPLVATQQGRTVERWLVTKCDVTRSGT
jgi:hypothetical protein